MSGWHPFANWPFSIKFKKPQLLLRMKNLLSLRQRKFPWSNRRAKTYSVRKFGLFERAWDALTKEICPNCRKPGGRQTSRFHVGSEQRPGIVTLKESRYDRDGNLTGAIEREVQVIKCIEIYDQRYECYMCGNGWQLRREWDVTRR